MPTHYSCYAVLLASMTYCCWDCWCNFLRYQVMKILLTSGVYFIFYCCYCTAVISQVCCCVYPAKQRDHAIDKQDSCSSDRVAECLSCLSTNQPVKLSICRVVKSSCRVEFHQVFESPTLQVLGGKSVELHCRVYCQTAGRCDSQTRQTSH